MKKDLITSSESSKGYEDAYAALQPVFDERGKVWGHELLYRDSAKAQAAAPADFDAATLKVTALVCLWPFRDVAPGERILVNFSDKSIVERLPLALPAEHTVVQAQVNGGFDRELIEALAELKRLGYAVALDGFKPGDSEKLVHLADLVIVDVLGKESQGLYPHIEAARRGGPKLMAKRVEDERAHDRAKRLGFELFQGYFFKRPSTAPGRMLSPTEASRMRLFKLLQDEDPDVDALSLAIGKDASLSYMLFRWLSSPFFGMPTAVTSIRQAVLLLGWTRLRNWLRVLISNETMTAGKTTELSLLAAHRARFLSDAAPEDLDRDGLFLLGLFSLLDVMLDMPMETLAAELPLSDPVRSALTGGLGEYTPWLNLVKGFEDGDWNRVDDLLDLLRLQPVHTARTYAKAADWAKSLMTGRAEHPGAAC